MEIEAGEAFWAVISASDLALECNNGRGLVRIIDVQQYKYALKKKWQETAHPDYTG